jgi:crotonobetainyl-CoA:carnitine CoA-transferase CaiB-like acyl-CoA transferase
MASPLNGIKVLELGQFIAGPFTGLQLADLGAQVIKVERPGLGDPFREFGVPGRSERGYSHHFCAFNRNKLSLTLDLGKPKGQELFRRAASKVDVVLQNYRPGVMQRLGIDYDVLSKLNPRLVYCAIAGFSEDGPYRDKPAYDAVGQAYSGLMGVSVEKEDPRVRGHTITDQVTGMQACSGVVAALYERERTGRGSRIDITMIEASLSFMPDAFTAYTQSGVVLSAQTRAAFSLGFVFNCADQKMIAIQVSSIEKFWKALIAAIERPDIGEDARFKDRPGRINNFQALIDVLRPVFAAKPHDFWMQKLDRHDVPSAPVHSIPEVIDDPEVRHLGAFHQLEHPRYGKMTALHRPWRINGERESDPLPPPALGEHTETVLQELGFAPAEIEELRNEKII